MVRVLVLMGFLAGCPTGGKEDLNGPSCEDTPTSIALDDATDLGITAQDLLDLSVGEHLETFRWNRDESTTELTLTVTHDGGEARFVDSEPVYPDGDEQPAIGVICDDRVEVDVTLGFVTADGSFSESWALPLVGFDSGAAEVHHALDPDALNGTYDMDADISEPFDTRSMWLSTRFDAEGSSGEVAGQIAGEEDCDGNECAAWAAEVGIGSWGPL